MKNSKRILRKPAEVTASVTILSGSSYEIEVTPNGSGTTLPDRVIRVE